MRKCKKECHGLLSILFICSSNCFKRCIAFVASFFSQDQATPPYPPLVPSPPAHLIWFQSVSVARSCSRANSLLCSGKYAIKFLRLSEDVLCVLFYVCMCPCARVCVCVCEAIELTVFVVAATLHKILLPFYSSAKWVYWWIFHCQYLHSIPSKQDCSVSMGNWPTSII